MSQSLAGSWAARVTRPSGVVDVVFHFTSNGMAFLVEGGNGAGTWLFRRTRCTFRIKEPVLDESGNYQGYIDINQSGQVTGDTFSTSGESNVYDAEDTLLYTRTVQIEGARRVATAVTPSGLEHVFEVWPH